MTPKALEKLRLEAARLVGVEADFSRQRQRKLELAKGADFGEETLRGALAGEGNKAATRAANKAAKAAGEAEALASAVVAARRVREVAVLAAWGAEGELLRQDGATLRVEAGVLQAKADDLLCKLRELTGADFVAGPRVEFFDVPLFRPLQYGADAQTTQMVTLLARADALDEEARVLGLREVSRAGSASGADVAGLFAAVAADPFRIGPTLAELSAWALTAEAAARSVWQAARWREHEPADDAAWSAAGVTFVALWRVGRIVLSESSCVVTRRASGVPPREGNPRWVAGASYSV